MDSNFKKIELGYNSFSDSFPSWSSYEHPNYHFASIPPSLPTKLQGFILSHVTHNTDLRFSCHVMARSLDIEPSKNVGREFLLSDLSKLIPKFSSAKFDQAMDCIGLICHAICDHKILLELNGIMEECRLGYRLTVNETDGLAWDLSVKPNTKKKAERTKTGGDLNEICSSARSRLGRARLLMQDRSEKKHLQSATRECIAALGVILAFLSGENDIGNAKKRLESESRIGLNTIIDDGIFIWGELSSAYRNSFSGITDSVNITEDEVLYWIERISRFIEFISKKR